MNVLVLSPHRDDAAFSCGLLLSHLLRAGASVTIVNVCTVSAYAPYLHASSEERVQQVTAARAREDYHFVEHLASVANTPSNTIRLVDLEWQDAPIRRNIADEEVLTAPVDEGERQALQRAFSAYAEASLVFVPAGVGDHIDHKLVRDAARDSFLADRVLFYEDLPYASRLEASKRPPALRNLVEWYAPAARVDGRKRDFARHYASQIANEVADELETYAKKLGGRERLYGTPEAVRTISEVLQPEGTLA